MQKINEVLKKYDFKPHRYEKKGKVTIVDTDHGRVVVKEKNRSRDTQIYQYLESRSFHYYPHILSNSDDDYEITEYVEEIDMPAEQKILDLIDLISLLHNKTTHYKEVDEADYKKIYEDINNNINYLTSYYNDIITIIESHVYMSPSEYLLARNISKVYASLQFCYQELEAWYELVKDKRKQRLVVLHNNLAIDHFLKNKNAYLINWDKSRIDIPIFDLYKLYKKHALDYDFTDLLYHYERNYPLLEEERKLFFILIALPDKIEFDESEYQMCRTVSREIDLLYKTEMLLSPYYAKDAKPEKK